jgi:hypothetical protein
MYEGCYVIDYDDQEYPEGLATWRHYPGSYQGRMTSKQKKKKSSKKDLAYSIWYDFWSFNHDCNVKWAYRNCNDMLHDTVSCTSVTSLFEISWMWFEACPHSFEKIDQGHFLGPPCRSLNVGNRIGRANWDLNFFSILHEEMINPKQINFSWICTLHTTLPSRWFFAPARVYTRINHCYR